MSLIESIISQLYTIMQKSFLTCSKS